MAGIGFELKKLFNRNRLYRTDAAWNRAASWRSVSLQPDRGLRTQQRAFGVYDHLYASVFTDSHQLSFHGGNEIYSRSAV